MVAMVSSGHSNLEGKLSDHSEGQRSEEVQHWFRGGGKLRGLEGKPPPQMKLKPCGGSVELLYTPEYC